MAYIPITSQSSTSSTEITGIPANTTRRYVQSRVGTYNVYTDYTSSLAPEGDFLKIGGTSVLITSIRNLLLTPIGSYPFDPTYGSDLYKKVFEPADQFTEEEIKTEVVDRIRQYDNRIRITDVTTEFYSNKKGFRINVMIKNNAVVTNVSVDITENVGFSIEEGQ